MSRSYRHTSICGITTAASEKDDKHRWHRRYRHHNRQLVRQGVEPVPLQAVSNPWDMAKEGKQWFDWTRHPWLLRK